MTYHKSKLDLLAEHLASPHFKVNYADVIVPLGNYLLVYFMMVITKLMRGFWQVENIADV